MVSEPLLLLSSAPLDPPSARGRLRLQGPAPVPGPAGTGPADPASEINQRNSSSLVSAQ